MENREEKLKKIIVDYKNKSNSELKYAMDEISNEFEDTKNLLVKLTHHLDALEHNYNNILEEYKNRTK